jgi:putative transposase
MIDQSVTYQNVLHVALGKPMQNAFAGSFNGCMRGELLSETLFVDLDDARAKVAASIATYSR